MNELRKNTTQELVEGRHPYGVYYGSPHQEDDDEIDLRTLWRTLMRYKWSILLITLLTFIATLVVTLSMTPVYRAAATIQIQREVEKVTNYEVNTQQQQVTDKDFYQTQYELLKSRVLARRVIDELGLDNVGGDEQLAKPFFSDLLDEAKNWFNETKASLVDSTTENEDLSVNMGEVPQEELFGKNLSIIPVKNSQIVKLEYEHKDPELAAQIVNTMADKFIAMNLERRASSATYAKEFLAEQLALAKSKLNESEKKLVGYAKKRGIVTTGDNEALVDKRLVELSLAVTDAEAKRIDAESRYKYNSTGKSVSRVRLDDLNTILADTSAAKINVGSIGGGASLVTVPDNSVVRALREAKARKEVEYQDKIKVYKKAHPTIIRIQQEINQLKVEIRREQAKIKEEARRQQAKVQAAIRKEQARVQAEIRRERARVKAEIKKERAASLRREKNYTSQALKRNYLAALQKEKELKKKLRAQKKLSFELKDKNIGYSVLKREVDTNRELYKGLLQRVKEVGVASVSGKNNISIVDEALVPYKQYKPNLKLNLAIGTLLGLMLGIGLSFLREMLNNTVKSSEEIERLSHLPILGLIPKGKGGKKKNQALLTIKEPKSAVAEAARSLRTNLLFSTKDGAPKILLFTSAMPNEGKTTAAINLASAFAQAGKKALLVDCDLRKPSIHSQVYIENTRGLSNYLVGECSLDEVIQPYALGELSVLPSGPISPNPVELFSSDRMKEMLEDLTMRYDTVILDGPPVMGLADALVLSNVASATVMVASHGETGRKNLSEACEKIRRANGNLIGCIYTKVTQDGGGYSYYDYYEYGN